MVKQLWGGTHRMVAFALQETLWRFDRSIHWKGKAEGLHEDNEWTAHFVSVKAPHDVISSCLLAATVCGGRGSYKRVSQAGQGSRVPWRGKVSPTMMSTTTTTTTRTPVWQNWGARFSRKMDNLFQFIKLHRYATLWSFFSDKYASSAKRPIASYHPSRDHVIPSCDNVMPGQGGQSVGCGW